MTEREIQAAKLDTSRDLAADLAEIEKHEPVWRISFLWEGRTEYAYKEYETWRIRLPLVAASAIHRAMAAEAEVKNLKADNAALRNQLRRMTGRLTELEEDR